MLFSCIKDRRSARWGNFGGFGMGEGSGGGFWKFGRDMFVVVEWDGFDKAGGQGR